MTSRAPIQWIAVVAGCLAAASAFADRTINVDGNAADWSGVTNCLSQVSGGGGGKNVVTLSRACLENDNSAGSNGKLYTLFESSSLLPTSTDIYFGFAVDMNGDGQLQSGDDEVYAVRYQPPPNKKSPPPAPQLLVFDFNNYGGPKRTYPGPADCGGAAPNNGWSESKSPTTVEVGISYGCIRFNGTGPALGYGSDTRLMQLGVYPVFATTDQQFYDGTLDSMWTPGAATPTMGYPTLTARSGQSELFWSNPDRHEGTLVVRSAGAPVSFVPANGTQYTTSSNVGSNQNVVFVEGQRGTTASFVDSGRANGTKYYYKVFNHYAAYTYSSGNVPVPNGVFGEPRASASNEPVWCYSTSLTSLQAPLARGGTAFTAGNGGALVAVKNVAGSNDGQEAWRPVPVGGAIQAEFARVPLYGRSGNYLVVGSQSGNVAVVNDATGAMALSIPGSNFGGDFIQAFIPIQLFNYTATNDPFRTAHPNRDLIFVPTRKAGTSTYKVAALSSVDGSVVWQSGDMSPIFGGMVLDYSHDRLYVPTTDSGPGSLKILSTLTGTQVGTLSVGAVSRPLSIDFYANNNKGQLIVVNDAGDAFGFSLDWIGTPPAASWTTPIGGVPVGMPVPISNGFIISVKNSGTTPGAVKKFTFSSTGAVTTKSLSIDNPSNPALQSAGGFYTRAWVGSSDQKLHGIDFGTWLETAQLDLPGVRPGSPSYDVTSNRIVTGTEDGRLCSFVAPP